MEYKTMFWLAIAFLIALLTYLEIERKYEYNCNAPRGVRWLTYFVVAVMGGCGTALLVFGGMYFLQMGAIYMGFRS